MITWRTYFVSHRGVWTYAMLDAEGRVVGRGRSYDSMEQTNLAATKAVKQRNRRFQAGE